MHIIEAKLPLSYGQEYVKTYRSNPELFTSPKHLPHSFREYMLPIRLALVV